MEQIARTSKQIGHVFFDTRSEPSGVFSKPIGVLMILGYPIWRAPAADAYAPNRYRAYRRNDEEHETPYASFR